MLSLKAYLVLLATWMVGGSLALRTVADSGPGDVAREIPADWQVYSNTAFGITLHHPPHWKPGPHSLNARINGPDGFVQLCVSGGENLADAALQFAAQRFRAFGSNPTIVPVRVHGRDARLIWPSDEVPLHRPLREGALVVRYPLDAVDRRRFLVLLADTSHIRDIVSTVQLVESPQGQG